MWEYNSERTAAPTEPLGVYISTKVLRKKSHFYRFFFN